MYAWIPCELVADPFGSVADPFGSAKHILGPMDLILPAALWSWRRLSQEYLLGGKDIGCVGMPIIYNFWQPHPLGAHTITFSLKSTSRRNSNLLSIEQISKS